MHFSTLGSNGLISSCVASGTLMAAMFFSGVGDP